MSNNTLTFHPSHCPQIKIFKKKNNTGKAMDRPSGVLGPMWAQPARGCHNFTKKVYYKSFLSTATTHWLIFLKDIGLI